jgi:hypothetical protein
VRFVETPLFTRDVDRLLSKEEFRSLQMALLFRPEQGALIPGSGGLRKLRWSLAGSGKRGGARVIYYRQRADESIFLLLIYRKSEQDDLSPAQLRFLKRLLREGLA